MAYNMTLDQVAAELGGVTRERVRQIEAKAIDKLRREFEKRGIDRAEVRKMLGEAAKRESLWETLAR